jgi:hypothetical protein
MTLDTDQPTTSGKVWTLPTPKTQHTKKGKEPMGQNKLPLQQPPSIQHRHNKLNQH